MHQVATLAWLAAGGAAGSLSRYGLSILVPKVLGVSFPWGTLVVNVLGCLAIGFVWPLAETRHLISPQARLIIVVGFLGAFTTFSSFAFETVQQMRYEQWLPAAGNVLAQNVVGLLCVLLGMKLGSLV